MRLFLAALLFLTYSQAQASYFESCRVWAKVLSRTDATHFVIQVRRVSMRDGSHGKAHCEALRAGSQLVSLDEDEEGGKLGFRDKDILLEYSYSDGLTPEGVVFTKRWKLLKKE